MNSSFFTLFIISLALLFLSCLNPIEAAKCNPDDEAGLLAFKSCITQDPSGLLSSWKKGTSCCSWNGVTCSNSHRVTGLLLMKDPQFPGGSISGTYSPLLAKLEHLEVIGLANQANMTGTFPRFLLHLPKLRHINFKNNGLSGSLPDNIGVLSQLKSLVLEGNRFTGSIPDSISNLTQLDGLFLGNNLLTGTIPLGFANLKLLINLNLDNNRFTGNIPNIFKNMKNLGTLDLSRNRFSGKLPPSLPSTLSYILLNQNNLSGTIPSYLTRFTGLEELDLSKNRFSGVLPKGFVNLRFIKKLIFSHNLLTDPLPVLSVNDMYVLDLSYNKFHLNKIPKWITLLPRLESLYLAKCGIKMSLTDWKPPSYCFDIDLSENEISGSPAKLLNYNKYIREFRAAGNKLRFDLGKLTFPETLETLDLSRNLVFGKVPATVAGLYTLNLSQNQLCGKLPVTKFPVNVFVGNKCLCGSPLSPCKV